MQTWGIGKSSSIFRHTAGVLGLVVGLFGLVPAGTAADRRVTAEALDEALVLARRYLLVNQQETGNFRYQYDFLTKQYDPGDSQVRQAGALWGLALVHRAAPTAETLRGLVLGLNFWRKHAAGDDKARWVRYPGARSGKTGAQALVILALVDGLAAAEDLDTDTRQRWQADLDAYLQGLLRFRREDGLFASRYLYVSGRPYGAPSPYFDGESLLALARLARDPRHAELRELAVVSAETMHTRYVVDALAEHPDSARTKGFYQRRTIAIHDLYVGGWPGTESLAARGIALGHWMIDVHETLSKTRNTAYAYEGLVSAHELARLSGDMDSREKFAAVIDLGLAKLLTWQVGHSRQNEYLLHHAADEDPLARGGVLNHAAEPQLRIDVTQHQAHAVILARRYLYQE